MEKVKVVIKRSEWGTGPEGRNLLNARSGKKCCLGFICEQAFGVEREFLLAGGFFPVGKSLDSLEAEVTDPAVKDAIHYYIQSSMRITAADINDDERTSREYKEEQLLKLFADTPFDVSFVD